MSTYSCKSVSWCWRCGWHFWVVLRAAVAITIINGSRYNIRSYILSRHKSRKSRLSISIFRCQLQATILICHLIGYTSWEPDKLQTKYLFPVWFDGNETYAVPWSLLAQASAPHVVFGHMPPHVVFGHMRRQAHYNYLYDVKIADVILPDVIQYDVTLDQSII